MHRITLEVLVNTCIYRAEMNRMSVVNGRVTKSKLRPERVRARELDICNRRCK